MDDLSFAQIKFYENMEMRKFSEECATHEIVVCEMFNIRTDYLRLKVIRGDEEYSIRIPAWVLHRQTLWEFLDKLREVLAHLFKIKEW